MTAFNPLDQFIAPHIRSAIEQRYDACINAQAQLQQALKDPLFLQNPSAHVALFADHGVVHVRDGGRPIYPAGLRGRARSAARRGAARNIGHGELP